MRKFLYIITILSLLISCTQKNSDGIIEINEKVFIGQVNDIYLNTKDYLGKIIKYEGIFMKGENNYGDPPFYIVFRYGPGGCCGVDGIAGFEVVWTDGKKHEYPEQDSWVEVIGEIKINNQYLYIEIDSITTKDKRGREYVTQ